MPKTKATHYVDNKQFFEALMEYKLEKKKALEESREMPQIPEYIGECLLSIAKKYSNRGSFNSYSYKDELVSDAVENCLIYLHNFNPDKSTNPFAYFTQIIHWAFIRRIAKEKKQTYTKLKVAINQSILGEDYDIIGGEDNDLKKPNWMTYENVDNLIRDFEEKITKKNDKYRDYKKRNSVDEVSEDELFSDEPLDKDMFDSIEHIEQELFNEDNDDEDVDLPKKKKNDLDIDGFDDIPESIRLNGDNE